VTLADAAFFVSLFAFVTTIALSVVYARAVRSQQAKLKEKDEEIVNRLDRAAPFMRRVLELVQDVERVAENLRQQTSAGARQCGDELRAATARFAGRIEPEEVVEVAHAGDEPARPEPSQRWELIPGVTITEAGRTVGHHIGVPVDHVRALVEAVDLRVMADPKQRCLAEGTLAELRQCIAEVDRREQEDTRWRLKNHE